MTRYSQAEKMEIIRLVETSELPVKQTLVELDVPRSTFYDWYRRYTERGYDGLAARQSQQQQFWNRIPDQVREQVVAVALEQTELSPRQLAWHLTDTHGYFISESSVYRILKGYDLVTSPMFQLVSAKDKFEHPTKWVNDARGQLCCLQSELCSDPLSMADRFHSIQGRGLGLLLSVYRAGRLFTLYPVLAAGNHHGQHRCRGNPQHRGGKNRCPAHQSPPSPPTAVG